MEAHEFERIAIVNRGESAMRLINAAREFAHETGDPLRTIALYTEADRRAMFVREADEAFALGSALSTDEEGRRRVRYLDYERVAEALTATRAEAVWAGWGFVSEHAAFVELCAELGIVFIGPDAATMRRLGDKITSKQLAEQADVPVAGWSGGPVATVAEARAHAERLGYPVMIKATAGGGGRGIRRVDTAAEIDEAFVSARTEAAGAVGDDTVFVEQLLGDARHIEVQIIADAAGTVWPVGVRDCSVQRRNQKLLEEAPSPALSAEQDRDVRAAAARLAAAAGYVNAGTVEFLYEPAEQRFSFMEVNARLQVEHPVTEVTTGLDLVKLQLHVARGGLLEGDPPPTVGVAIEARLNAEDPQRGFAPAPGRLDLLRLPTGPGLRVDTGVEEGDVIAPEFDSMIAKIIAVGRDRGEALSRLRRALGQTTVMVRDGMTNKAFLHGLLTTPEVERGDIDVGWVDRNPDLVGRLGGQHADIALLAAAIAAYREATHVEIRQFRSSATRGRPEVDGDMGRTVELGLGGQRYRFDVRQTSATGYRVAVDGEVVVVVELDELGSRAGTRLTCGHRSHHVFSAVEGVTHLVEVDGHTHRIVHDEGGVIRAPSPAVVVTLPVAVGDEVAPGDRLAVIEAMKMETAIVAEFAGTVREVLVRNNTQVGAGAPLLVVEPRETDADLPAGARVEFGRIAVDEEIVHDRCRHLLEALRHLLLGYDIDASVIEAMGRGAADPCADPVEPEEQAVLEEEILSLFVDIISLFRRSPVDEELDVVARRSSEEHLFDYLRSMEARGDGLPEPFVDQLVRTVGHFGIADLTPGPDLEEALFRIVRSHQRMARQIGPVVRVLENRLDHPGSGDDPVIAELLDRVVRESRHRFPAVHDLAAELSYREFDQPFLDDVRARALDDAARHLAALEADPDSAERDEHIGALVACSQPLKTLLSERFSASSSAVRRALLEVMTRRYYRIRDLEDMTTGELDGVSFAAAEYDHDDTRIHVFSTHVDFDDLASGAAALRPLLEGVDPDHDMIVDFYVWQQTAGADLAATRDHAQQVLGDLLGPLALRRVVLAISSPESGSTIGGVVHILFRADGKGRYRVEEQSHGLHPMMGKRLQLWRLDAFGIERVPSPPDVYLFQGRAHVNPRDERLFALGEVRDMTAVRDETGAVQRVPELERVLQDVLGSIRRFQARRPQGRRLQWNRIILYVWPPLDLTLDDMARLAERIAPDTADLGIEKVLLLARVRDADGQVRRQVFDIDNPTGGNVRIRLRDSADNPLEPLDDYGRRVVGLRQRGLVYPFDLVRMLAPEEAEPGGFPPGEFVEYDLVDDRLVAVQRPPGQNTANVIAGVISNTTEKHPEGMRRVILLGDPTTGMGNLAEAECRRINAAMDLADELGVPLEWFAVSAGARISLESGTENMDWIARVLRRIIEFTQGGGEINIVVTGINVGAQPYWNAEATMLMHTKGILVMTGEGSMVLTGKEALDYSGGVSAEDNQGIGGYERIMGPNGQAQYFARDIGDACRILLRHYDHAYVPPGERFPRAAPTRDPRDRDVCESPHGGDFATVGEVFSSTANPDRKRPFDIRRVMAAAVDDDQPTMERWYGVEGAELVVVWDAHLGGTPVCLLGIESTTLPRVGSIPTDGPDQWTAGTLFPKGSKKMARAINAASGSRPLVVLANLSGFDGSPESLRTWQLEFGAEIGRAVVNFDGPIVFLVVSRYHGGAFVVFSRTLHDNMEVAAVEGSRASVIGGAPAAAVVFAREVQRRTKDDPELQELEQRVADADGADRAELRHELTVRRQEVHARMLGEMADEFDAVHSIERALRVGSIQRIIAPSEIRPYLIDAVERGMARDLEHR